MTTVPPLTRQQCEIIVARYERRVLDAESARQRYIQATTAAPLLSAEAHQAHLVGMESAALFAEEEAACAQLLARLAAIAAEGLPELSLDDH